MEASVANLFCHVSSNAGTLPGMGNVVCNSATVGEATCNMYTESGRGLVTSNVKTMAGMGDWSDWTVNRDAGTASGTGDVTGDADMAPEWGSRPAIRIWFTRM